MKILTYNVMSGAVKPDPSRLHEVLTVLGDQDAEVVGLQETKPTRTEENELLWAIRDSTKYPYDVVFDRDEKWVYGSATSMFSKMAPVSKQIIGSRVRAVEMVFPAVLGELSVCNTYLSHVSEAERLPQVQDILGVLRGKKYSILMGDFNALSPEDGIPQRAVDSFSDRMKAKYCRDGKLCYDTIEAVLEEGYIDVGLHFHKPEEITDKSDLSGGTGNHTRPVRMDFIFARAEILPYITEFVLVNKELARRASDHFPWSITLDKIV